MLAQFYSFVYQHRRTREYKISEERDQASQCIALKINL